MRPSTRSGFGRAIALCLMLLVPLSLGAVGTPASPAKAAAAAASTHTRWSWPIAAPRVLARAYSAPPTPYGPGHRGIDLMLALGEPVRAPEAGIVHFVGVVVNRAVVSIEHPGGLISSFEPVISTLVDGEAVTQGEVIGTLGSYGPRVSQNDASLLGASRHGAPQLGAPQSGHCGAPCLHVGARLHGQYVSPLKYLGGIPHSVLLPTRALH